MSIRRADRLDNFIPREGFVEARNGWIPSVETDAPVESIMVWRGPASQKILIAAGSDILDATGGSIVSVFTGATNARWQHVNHATEGGHFIRIVNGADEPLVYDGTTATTAPGITGSGLTASTLIDVFAHKNRLFFIEDASARFWYLAPVAIGGAAEPFDLGSLFNKGGFLQAAGSWSVDGGAGPDDLAVFVSSEGQVAIYAGDDPGDADAWQIVGVFDISRPIGRRCLIKVGGDLAVLTEGGMVPLSRAIVEEKATADNVAITNRINNAFQDAARDHRNKFGWQAILWERGELGFINVPTAELIRAQQFVINITTGAWCRFVGIDAICFGVHNGDLYFGHSGGLGQYGRGFFDNGVPIQGDLVCGWSTYQAPGQLKLATQIRPIYESGVSLQPSVTMGVDFNAGTPIAMPTVISGERSLWDVALWDVARWGPSRAMRLDWVSVTGLGIYLAPVFRFTTQEAAETTNQAIKLVSFDVCYQNGGVL